MAYTESWLTGPSSTSFYTRTYLPSSEVKPKAAVVFVHGFAEHIARYEVIFLMYAARGIAVFAYDQRGFGKTAMGKEGKLQSKLYGRTSGEEQAKDIEWALAHVKSGLAKDGVPVFLMGHSMGGGLVLSFATHQPPRSAVRDLAGVIASSPMILQTNPAARPVVWLGGMASMILPNQLIPVPLDINDLSHDKERNQQYAEDPMIRGESSLKAISDMLGGGRKLLEHNHQFWPSTLPVVFLHGDADQITSVAATEAFCEKIPADDKRVHKFANGFHELMNEPEGVKEDFTNRVIEWIEEHLSTAVSTTDTAAQPVSTPTPSSKL